MRLRANLAIGTVLLIAVLVSSSAIEAQQARTYQFSCSVDRTVDDVRFGSLNRSVICPVTARFVSVGSSAIGKLERRFLHQSGACLISAEKTKCTGSITHPTEKGFRLERVSTARTLLRDAEVASGAVTVSEQYPEVLVSGDGSIQVSHRYTFPSIKNPYFNSATPCDIDGSGNVNPLDALFLASFLRLNNMGVNLSSYDAQGTPTKFVDPTNDWVSNNEDYTKVVNCLNGF